MNTTLKQEFLKDLLHDHLQQHYDGPAEMAEQIRDLLYDALCASATPSEVHDPIEGIRQAMDTLMPLDTPMLAGKTKWDIPLPMNKVPYEAHLNGKSVHIHPNGLTEEVSETLPAVQDPLVKTEPTPESAERQARIYALSQMEKGDYISWSHIESITGWKRSQIHKFISAIQDEGRHLKPNLEKPRRSRSEIAKAQIAALTPEQRKARGERMTAARLAKKSAAKQEAEA